MIFIDKQLRGFSYATKFASTTQTLAPSPRSPASEINVIVWKRVISNRCGRKSKAFINSMQDKLADSRDGRVLRFELALGVLEATHAKKVFPCMKSGKFRVFTRKIDTKRFSVRCLSRAAESEIILSGCASVRIRSNRKKIEARIDTIADKYTCYWVYKVDEQEN